MFLIKQKEEIRIQINLIGILLNCDLEILSQIKYAVRTRIVENDIRVWNLIKLCKTLLKSTQNYMQLKFAF